MPLSRVIAGIGEETQHWVYTGSTFTPDGYYVAEAAGTLVGFVHDTWSIIQHREGLGLGNYGAITIDAEVLPAAGSAVLLRVQRSAEER